MWSPSESDTVPEIIRRIRSSGVGMRARTTIDTSTPGPPRIEEASNRMQTAASSSLRSSYRVAVIGAGVAGLTAARELLTSKRLRADELVVLEATNRIGGRVQSLSFGSQKPVVIEVGAAWIHGASEGNPFFRDLIEQPRVQYKAISDRNPWLYPKSCKGFQLYGGNGRTPLSEEDCQYTWKLSETLLQTLHRFATDDELEAKYGDCSVQEIVDQLLVLEDGGNLTNVSSAAAALQSLVVQHPRGKELVAFCLVLVECWMGAKSDSLQLEDFEEIDLIGDDPGAHCLVTYGMEQTIQQLALSIDTGVIHTNTPVELVEYTPSSTTSEGGVTLHLGGAGRKGRSVHVDHVIVTCSLGALKAEKIKFAPPLPEEKIGAIQRSSMGQYMKVLVEFPDVFWPETVQFFGHVGSTDTKSRNPDLQFPLVFNYYSVKGAPLLEAVLFGTAAQQASDLDDSAIIAAFFTHLCQLFGDDIPPPRDHFITRWDKDPWALGAYSYMTLESSSADPELLRQTVAGRVLFAGEATNAQYQGALQAAYLSGLAAVDELDTL